METDIHSTTWNFRLLKKLLSQNLVVLVKLIVDGNWIYSFENISSSMFLAHCDTLKKYEHKLHWCGFIFVFKDMTAACQCQCIAGNSDPDNLVSSNQDRHFTSWVETSLQNKAQWASCEHMRHCLVSHKQPNFKWGGFKWGGGARAPHVAKYFPHTRAASQRWFLFYRAYISLHLSNAAPMLILEKRYNVHSKEWVVQGAWELGQFPTKT